MLLEKAQDKKYKNSERELNELFFFVILCIPTCNVKKKKKSKIKFMF